MDKFRKRIELAFQLDRARLAGYEQADLDPVERLSFESIGIERMRKSGFVVVNLEAKFTDKCRNPRDVVANFARSVGVNTPHIPLHYNAEERGRLFSHPATTISPMPRSPHGEFDSNKAQGIHFDGTLEAINIIRTAMLYCHQPAIEGGENTIYNVVGALYDLYQRDINLVYPLFDPHALTKFSPKDSSMTCSGPVASFGPDGRLVTRFSNEYCTEPGDKSSVFALKMLYQRLTENLSPLRYVTLKLEKGQVLVLANNQVSHDRSAFSVDIPPRELYRAIFDEDLLELKAST